MIFDIEAFVPLEIIAKIPINQNESKALIVENHFLRLVADDNYVCKVLEEIIFFDKAK